LYFILNVGENENTANKDPYNNRNEMSEESEDEPEAETSIQIVVDMFYIN
jgi:hypothetical protein